MKVKWKVSDENNSLANENRSKEYNEDYLLVSNNADEVNTNETYNINGRRKRC